MKNGNQSKSNSEPHPDLLAENLISFVIEVAFHSPRTLKSPRDLLLRAQETRKGRVSHTQPTCHTFSSLSIAPQASDLNVVTFTSRPMNLCPGWQNWGPGLGIPSAQCSHCPKAVPGRGSQFPQLRQQAPQPEVPSHLAQAPSLCTFPMFPFFSSVAIQEYLILPL